MMAALNVHSKASLLSATTKRIRDESKPFKKIKKKEKSEEPIVIQQSLRTRGLNPDNLKLIASLPFDSAYVGEGPHSQFVDTILGIANKGRGVEKIEYENGFDLSSLSLEPHNVAHVVPKRVLVVKFLPREGVKMIAAGDKLGKVGFWNLDCQDEEDDGIHLFSPHSAPISSLVFQQHNLSRVISSSYDGLIRLMDVEKLVFDLVYSNDEGPIFSLSQRPDDEQSLYFGEGTGMFKIWDIRAGKSSFDWELHQHRINSIDFNPQNPNIMATSSSDSTACLWDLRYIGAKKPKALTTLNHDRAVHSAYFSPSGLSLATTSIDNYIGILSGANFEDTCMIYHDNRTDARISIFRGIWGWDDSYIFVANQSKGISVISPKLKRTVMELQNPLMKAIPCRLHSHPLNVGIHIWRRSLCLDNKVVET